MSFVEEFELLNDTRGDLRDKPWRQPLVREAMRIAHRLERAQEEVQRLNVEVRRLHTSIRDEDTLFSIVLDDLRDRGDIWHGPVHDHVIRRRRVNARLLVYVEKIYDLEGFTGTAGPGQRAGAVFPVLLPQRELRARVAAAAVSESPPPSVTDTSVDGPATGSPSSDPALTTEVMVTRLDAAAVEIAPASVLAKGGAPLPPTPPSPFVDVHPPGATSASVAPVAFGCAATSLSGPPSATDKDDSLVNAPTAPTLHPPNPAATAVPSSRSRSPAVGSSASPPAVSVEHDVLDVERRVVAREEDVSDGEDDDGEEQATAYADFVASML